ncbi:MAG TPA: hypothetical protein VJS44_19035 [Pyrinomonadaceae bacterium]|nr:hypothetical protein [Pyrinomonadaceae bacterium]
MTTAKAAAAGDVAVVATVTATVAAIEVGAEEAEAVACTAVRSAASAVRRLT